VIEIRKKKNLRLLEIGPSIFLPFFKFLFPELSLVTLDRPLKMDGADNSFCIDYGKAETHYNADLNQVELGPDFGDPPLGIFDFICCSEVIEHLLVNPVDFFRNLLNLLEPEGMLYLSTPNFFSSSNLKKIEQRINPLHVFPGRSANKDMHFHVREFSMNELESFIKLAGGDVQHKMFSDCWDRDESLSPDVSPSEDQKSNLVIVARKQLNP